MSPIQPDLLRADDFPVEFGRYTLQGLLGEGGMARVFRAELQGPSGFRKAAAVKIIRASVAARSEALRASLKNEARLGGLLHHPNIVDTYDYGEVDDLPYIAMEMVRGLGLDVVLNMVRPLPAPLAVEIGAQICAGLDHAHNLEDAAVDSQLVHRDLKPSNVIVSRDGLVKVMDFGIAKATMISEGNTQTGMTKGTPAYMSPEQVGGEELDPRSDLFAMGAILYELVTGERLFSGDSIMSVLMGVVRVEERMADPAVLTVVEERAPGMANIILRCLRKEREDRYADAAELEHTLRIVARDLPPPPSMKKWVRALMKRGGVAGADPSASSLPVNSPRTPTPLTPARPAAAALGTGGGAIPPTAAISIAPPPTGARPVPPPPPATPVEVPGPTRTQIASMEHSTPRAAKAPRRRRAKAGVSPLLLLALGLLVGSAAAVVVVLVWTVITEKSDPPPPEILVEDLPAPPPVVVAEAPTPDVAPAATPAERRRDSSTRKTTSRAPSAAAKTPAAVLEDSATPFARKTPAPEAAHTPTPAAPTPDRSAAIRAAQERERLLLERAAREEGRRKRRELAERAAKVPDPVRALPPDTGKVPAPPPNTRLRVAGAFAVPYPAADDDEVRVRFTAEVHGKDIDDVTVRFNPRGASWITRPMRSSDGTHYAVNVDFKERNQGLFYYYVVVTDKDGEKAYRGTEREPLSSVAE